MRTLFLSGLLLFSFTSFTQVNTDKYIELVANVDWYGDVGRVQYAYYPKEGAGQADTSLNFKKIDELIKAKQKSKERPLTVINELAQDGWVMISTTFVPGYYQEQGRDKGKMIYYLRKTF